MSSDGQPHIMRTVCAVAIGAHLTAVAFYLAGGLGASGPVIDPLRPLPIAGIYAAPALIALAGLRRRNIMLLAAAIAAGVLAIVPFSLHSFVLAPAAAVYAIAYARVAAHTDLRTAMLSVLGAPVLLVTALLVLVIQDHPACYEERASGEVVIDRDPGPTTSGTATIEPDSDVVRAGCTSDVIMWWEATASLALSSTAVATGLFLPPSRTTRTPRAPAVAE